MSAGGSAGLELVTVRGITVNAAIASQVEALLAAAEADGFTFTGGGHRSPERQIELRRQNCGTSYYAIYEMPSSQCSPPTARPGRSMHERGLAIDFNCRGGLVDSALTRASSGWPPTPPASASTTSPPSPGTGPSMGSEATEGVAHPSSPTGSRHLRADALRPPEVDARRPPGPGRWTWARRVQAGAAWAMTFATVSGRDT